MYGNAASWRKRAQEGVPGTNWALKSSHQAEPIGSSLPFVERDVTGTGTEASETTGNTAQIGVRIASKVNAGTGPDI